MLLLTWNASVNADIYWFNKIDGLLDCKETSYLFKSDSCLPGWRLNWEDAAWHRNRLDRFLKLQIQMEVESSECHTPLVGNTELNRQMI